MPRRGAGGQRPSWSVLVPVWRSSGGAPKGRRRPDGPGRWTDLEVSLARMDEFGAAAAMLWVR